MKKLVAFFILFLLCVACAGLWFSPLGGGYRYENNVKGDAVSLVYPSGFNVRKEYEGDREAMYKELNGMYATIVKEVETDGLFMVYAYSPRVSDTAYLSDGSAYNVMAACRADGTFCIGAPLLEGSY